MIPNSAFYDLNYIKNSRWINIYVYDYTNFIDKEIKEIVLSKITIEDFYNNVKPNGKWDVKTSFGWNVTFGIKYQETFISYNFPFIYRESYCSPENLGNILYGYIGRWIGFSDYILTNAGSMVSIITSGVPDNDIDRYNILLGGQYYEDDYT